MFFIARVGKTLLSVLLRQFALIFFLELPIHSGYLPNAMRLQQGNLSESACHSSYVAVLRLATSNLKAQFANVCIFFSERKTILLYSLTRSHELGRQWQSSLNQS